MDLFSKNSFRMNVVLHFLDISKIPPFVIQLVVVVSFYIHNLQMNFSRIIDPELPLPNKILIFLYLDFPN